MQVKNNIKVSFTSVDSGKETCRPYYYYYYYKIRKPNGLQYEMLNSNQPYSDNKMFHFFHKSGIGLRSLNWLMFLLLLLL